MIDSPPAYEKIQQERLNDLQAQIAVYNEAEQRGDAAATEVEAQRVASAMRNVADGQSDPKTRKEWHKRAEKFTSAANSARKGILKEGGGIVVGVLSIPFQVAGSALSIVGGILHGVGGLLVGVGNVVKGGPEKVTGTLAGSSRNGSNAAVDSHSTRNNGSSNIHARSLGDSKSPIRDT